MKLGIVGAGNVGCAIALAAVTRGSARELVLVDRSMKVAEAVATDLRYGTPLGPRIDIAHGDYEALDGSGVVLITAGVNEKTGGATDRSDPEGRLRLLEKNAAIYREIVPRIVRAAPQAVLVAVSDPPDPLADVARKVSGHERVLSTGTFLDSLRVPLDRATADRTMLRASVGESISNDERRIISCLEGPARYNVAPDAIENSQCIALPFRLGPPLARQFLCFGNLSTSHHMGEFVVVGSNIGQFVRGLGPRCRDVEPFISLNIILSNANPLGIGQSKSNLSTDMLCAS